MRDVMVMVRGKGEGREMLTKPTQYLLHFTFIMKEIHCQSGAAGGLRLMQDVSELRDLPEVRKRGGEGRREGKVHT